jgi:hypothetical protein
MRLLYSPMSHFDSVVMDWISHHVYAHSLLTPSGTSLYFLLLTTRLCATDSKRSHTLGWEGFALTKAETGQR